VLRLAGEEFSIKRGSKVRSLRGSVEERISKVQHLMRSLMDSPGVIVASLFGSCKREDYDESSDVDILFICEREKDKRWISERVAGIRSLTGYPIHATIFTLNDVKRRIMRHDYLLASILEDSIPILGDLNFFTEARENILYGKPDAKSVRFNRLMGERLLKRAFRRFSRVNRMFNNPYTEVSRDHLMGIMLRGLTDYNIALGYLNSSVEMEKLNRPVTLRYLLNIKSNQNLRRFILMEKNIKKDRTFNPRWIIRLLDTIRTCGFYKLP